MRFSTRVRPGGSSTSTPLRHAFPPPVTALSPWLRHGHGTAYRHLSQRYLHWRPLGVSWRRNCLSEAFLISTALSTTASDSYSISSFVSQPRFVTVYNVCTVSLQSFDITPPKSFLLIIIIICQHHKASKWSAANTRTLRTAKYQNDAGNWQNVLDWASHRTTPDDQTQLVDQTTDAANGQCQTSITTQHSIMINI